MTPAERAAIPEPTAQQCVNRDKFETDTLQGFYTWYPQMGGYAGKCAAVNYKDEPVTEYNFCFEAIVWHDGDFPFDADQGNPRVIHHCEPSQFISFGEQVMKYQKERT